MQLTAVCPPGRSFRAKPTLVGDVPCSKGEQGSKGSGTNQPRHGGSSICHVSPDVVPRPDGSWDGFPQRTPSCQPGLAPPTRVASSKPWLITPLRHSACSASLIIPIWLSSWAQSKNHLGGSSVARARVKDAISLPSSSAAVQPA